MGLPAACQNRYAEPPQRHREGKRRRALMAMTVRAVKPVAHLPLVLGVRRKLDIAMRIDERVPPHPANVLSWGRGVAAFVWAMLDGDHALYTVGTRLHERGMLPLLQDG
jgi:Domain of unknown function (DUF4277)